MRLLAALLLVGALPWAMADSATPPANDLLGLRQPASLRVGFSQEKRIPGIQRVLKASGQLVFSRELGAIWRIEQPRPRETVIPLASKTATPAENEVSATIASMLSGDLGSLRRHFEITATPAGDGGGTLVLVPRNTGVRDVIKRVTLRIVDRSVSEIHMEESSGGTIDLTFTSPELDYKLTDAERASLGQASR